MKNHDHLLTQLKCGEFTPDLCDEARSMTAREFAAKHGVPVQGTGLTDPCGLVQVSVGCADFFWAADTGKFDGWGGSV